MSITENSVDVGVGDRRRRKRVLMLAYACSPYRGSEAGVGWQRAIATAKHFDTWVLHGKREYASEIKRYLKDHGEIPGLHFLYVPEIQSVKWAWRLPKGVYLANNLWHRRAYRIAARLQEQLSFDIVHQVTWCGFREPGYLWKLDAPFVWGPVGGTQNYPWRFLIQAGVSGTVSEATRSILNMLQLRFSPRVRKASRKAAALLTANSTGMRDFQRVHNVNPILMLETGVNKIARRSPPIDYLSAPLRIIWSGEFKHHKALWLLLEAIARTPPSFNYHLRILGHGPLEKRWRRLARKLNVEKSCEWMGWLNHKEAMQQYEWADIIVYTSLRDTSGNVVLEALSRGVPAICLDHQGVGDIVRKDCGIKIPVTKPADVVFALRDAIISLAQNRVRLEALSHGAIERARDYLWSFKAEQTAEIYNEVLERQQMRNSMYR